MKNSEQITIECFGCKRTQTLRKSKLIKCDYYTCSLGSCKLNPDLEIPHKEGYMVVTEHNVAGGFCGINFRKQSQEDLESINRAKQIKNLGLIQSKEQGQNYKCN